MSAFEKSRASRTHACRMAVNVLSAVVTMTIIGTESSKAEELASQGLRKGGGTYKVGASYQINGETYTPAEESSNTADGIASWYGNDFHGRRTANGEIYDMDALTAAHKTLPLPSYVLVTNLANGRILLLRINDRGPFVAGRIIDLSRQAARLLGFEQQGHTPVHVEYAGRGPLDGNDAMERWFLSSQSWYEAPSGQIDKAARDTTAVPPRPPGTTSALTTGSLAPPPLRSNAAITMRKPPIEASTVARPIPVPKRRNDDEEDGEPPASQQPGQRSMPMNAGTRDPGDESWRCRALSSCHTEVPVR